MELAELLLGVRVPVLVRVELERELAVPPLEVGGGEVAADAEDVARGGQTLATLLVYLNDVDDGGCTRFNKLGITVAPKKGDACLFFPADADGKFDERMEHEGEAPRAEKWIGRIWVHARPIIGETGCPPGTLEALRNR